MCTEKYKNLEKTKQNYLLKIQIMGQEKQVKIIGKPISLSLERGVHKADSESLFLFSDMIWIAVAHYYPKQATALNSTVNSAVPELSSPWTSAVCQFCEW